MPAPDDTFKTGDGAPSHEYSVHLMAQIVSNSAQQAEGRVVGDAGFKSGNWPFPHEAGENLPLVRNRPGLTVSSLSAEHTVFDVDNDALGEPLELGERVGFPCLSLFLPSIVERGPGSGDDGAVLLGRHDAAAPPCVRSARGLRRGDLVARGLDRPAAVRAGKQGVQV